MKDYFNTSYPSTEYLRLKAKTRIPSFAFDYVDNGCFNNVGMLRNNQDLRKIELMPNYIEKLIKPDLKSNLFGVEYSAPFGISALGLQGLIWPNAPEILAKAAVEHNIPFMLSTVTSASIEKIAKITNGNFWFQLYHPTDDNITDDILERCKNVGVKNLVIVSDVPSFSYRPKEIKNGLTIPPKLTPHNIKEMMLSPKWCMQMYKYGKPQFETLSKYMPPDKDTHHLSQFMNKVFDGRLTNDRIKRLRDRWDGNLIIKGISSCSDVQHAIDLGVDGVTVSNHGGRQLEYGPSTISQVYDIVKKYSGKIVIMMDGGIRNGADMANALSVGVDFTFLGRVFMYSVAALGEKGGDHAINMLSKQLQQVMAQVGAEHPNNLTANFIDKGYFN
ncbi:TPA: alpha-hydroxy acid oxidase [Photobacterium damselae]